MSDTKPVKIDLTFFCKMTSFVDVRESGNFMSKKPFSMKIGSQLYTPVSNYFHRKIKISFEGTEVLNTIHKV